MLVYPFLGTSRELAVGPTAIVSLLVGAGIQVLQTKSTSDYIAYAILSSLIVGLMQFLLGVFRLGFLINFLSHPVISGFTSASGKQNNSTIDYSSYTSNCNWSEPSKIYTWYNCAQQ